MLKLCLRQRNEYGNVLHTFRQNLTFENTEEKIERWMAASDTSHKYKAARESHQAGTGSWLIQGTQFRDWRDVPNSILWIHGGRA